MDKEYFNMNNFGVPPYYNYDNFSSENGTQNSVDNNMFNPLMQYEQAYMYYRYLSQQMEYKIKCKEYERLSASATNSRTNTIK